MLRSWAEDIRVKTKDMSREQTAEYVMNYYWYHILLGVLALGLLVLGIYHVTWGKRTVDFSLAIVNQDINHARDEALRDAFAASSGIQAETIEVDSDYLISYGNVKLDGVNESSYEKFFFKWRSGGLDAVVMPESFYEYCKKQGGGFIELKDYASPVADSQEETRGGCLLEEALKEQGGEGGLLVDDGKGMGLYIEGTKLAGELKQDADDPLVLVIPDESRHDGACRGFLEYVLVE